MKSKSFFVDARKLESDLRRARSDLASARGAEHDLRAQLQLTQTQDRSRKDEISKLREDNDNLQTRFVKFIGNLLVHFKAVFVKKKVAENWSLSFIVHTFWL